MKGNSRQRLRLTPAGKRTKRNLSQAEDRSDALETSD